MQIRVLAVIGLLLLGGCGKGGNLTAESAAPLVLSAAMGQCSTEGIMFNSPRDISVVDEFVQGLPAKGYVPATVNPELGYALTQGLNYQIKDHTMLVKYVGNNGTDGLRMFYACLLVPDSVNIKDVTVDQTGKAATVIFSYGPAVHTRFADDLSVIASRAVQPMIDGQQKSSVWTSEHQAFLQKLDSSGWRVSSIN